MTSRSSSGARTRAGVLAVGAGIIASLAFAGSSLAAAPATGSNCQTDGRIDGGGATFQNNAQRVVFEPGFRTDICGPVPGGPTDTTNDPNSSSRMVLYNYAARSNHTPSPLTGSGSGVNGAICRVDAYEGSDVPYTIAQLTRMRGAKPLSTDSECTGFNDASFTGLGSAPFQPSPAPYPDAADAQTGIMGFPVAGGAVAVGVNLPAGSCGADTPPTTINLSSSNASLLFGGVIQTWNDSRLVADNAGLTNCSVAVSRFARSDGSGTTTIFKNYLNHADGATALCDGTTWSTRTGQNGGNFPSGAGCSAITYASGNPAVVDATAGTAGGLGYGDLSDWRTRQPALALAPLRSADNSAFVSPLSGSGSNCTFAGASVPAGGDNGAVSMIGNAWASDASPNRSDVTYLGNGYPACGFTFALVRPGLSAGAGTGAIARLNANQRRTLYSYVLYELTPAAQTGLSSNYYAPLPATFLASIRRGFVANF